MIFCFFFSCSLRRRVSTPVEAVAHNSMAVCSTTCWRLSLRASPAPVGASELVPAEFDVLTIPPRHVLGEFEYKRIAACDCTDGINAKASRYIFPCLLQGFSHTPYRNLMIREPEQKGVLARTISVSGLLAHLLNQCFIQPYTSSSPEQP
jgi:hypothetical protein